jgi:hypothetical protein
MRMDDSNPFDIANTVERYPVPAFRTYRPEPRFVGGGEWNTATTNSTITAAGSSTAPDMYLASAAQSTALQQLLQRNAELESESQQLINRVAEERAQLRAQSAPPVNTADMSSPGISMTSINRAINQALGMPDEEESNENSI